MREELLQELETEYEQLRTKNERLENARKERIRTEYPEIYAFVQEREELVFGTLRAILDGKAETENLPERMEKLSAQIREKLTAAGLPGDYLAPIYHCEICKDTGRTGEIIKEPCECMKKAYQRKLREKVGLNSDGKETFETFDLSVFPDEPLPGRNYSQREQMILIRDDCEEWANSYPNVKCRNLLLNGQSGLGKTFLLHSIADRLIGRNADVLIISAYRLLEFVRKAYFSNEESAGELTEAGVLMIDDLGSEPLMQNVTVEQLFNLLNERLIKGLSTVISTNLTMEELQGRYTERIASRLRDKNNWKVITLEGKDIRS